MKSLLLITPENPGLKLYRQKQRNNFSQLTMPYLAGFVPDDFTIELVDEQYQDIPRKHFDLVGITVNTPNAPHAYRIASDFRSGGSRVVMGGPHVTLMPEEATAHADTIFIGEAEETWVRFLNDFLHHKAESVYQSLTAPELKNLPVPRRDLLKMPKKTAGSVFATRGCSYNCSYCCLKSIYHTVFRSRPVREVIEDIRTIRSNFFVFWDDNFFNDHTYTKELLKNLAPLGKRWAAQMTLADCKDRELLDLAGKAGCIYLFIGLESFSNDSLIEVNKTINKVGEYSGIIRLIHHYGISIQAGIVFGFDSDTRETFSKTLRACHNVKLDGITPSILAPYPGTELYNVLGSAGRLRSVGWSYYDSKTKVAFEPAGMGHEELLRGFNDFRKRFYSVPAIASRFFRRNPNRMYNLFLNLGYRRADRHFMRNSKVR